jgi:hypothetical protein
MTGIGEGALRFRQAGHRCRCDAVEFVGVGATVGTPYLVSIVMAWVAAGLVLNAQPRQWRLALALISSVFLSSCW